MRFVTSRIFLAQPKGNPIAEKIKSAGSNGTVKTASTKVESNIKNLGEYAHPKGSKKSVEVEACDENEVTATGETEIKVAEMPEFIKEKIDAKKGKKGDEKDEKEASAKSASIKVAEEDVEKYEAGKKEATEFTNDAEKKPEDAEKPEKNAGKAATTKTKTQDGTFPSSGQPQWEGKPENNNSPEMPTDKNTKASADDLLKRVLAGLSGKFEKTANLTPELKKDTKEYWRALYGEDYADAMVADK